MLSAELPIDPLTTAAVRAAFADGLSPESAALLLRARDSGLEWEPVTEAVALGLADHYARDGGSRLPAPVGHAPRERGHLWRVRATAVVAAALAYVLLRPVLGVGHELAVAGVAWLMHIVIGTGFWEPAIRFLGLDPIYAGAAIRAAGGVQVTGFAIAGPLGDALHNLVPAVFLSPDQVADGAGVSMVATPGSPAIGRGLAAFGADLVWLTFGLWLFWRWRQSRWWLALLGLFIQAQIAVNHLLDAQIGLADIDASGLPFALQVAMPNGGWFTTELAGLSAPLRDAIIGGVLVVLGYLIAVGGLLVVNVARRLWSRKPRRQNDWSARPWPVPVLLSAGLAVATAASPIGAMALGASNWQTISTAQALGMRGVVRSGRVAHTLRLAGATPVAVVQTPQGGWQYLVDGVPETIRGVGYNPQYANLPVSDRTALYQRDFADMHRLGINTIEGWFEGQFDSVTLDNAARNGIGVLMPFELNQDWDYTNPNVQQSILDHVSAYVLKYKDHPAVRMWAPGNENLHRILYPHWVSQENVPAARARADAFAAFLPVLVDRIHQLDPNHPVVYRDAEDVYLKWITDAFAKDGVDRPWLVYGANVYSTPRLQDIISKWPSQWPGRPLLISEFAPGGVGPAERPLGFEQQWAIIQQRSDVVLGGLAYTWATNGPEDLDRVFGLVDANGVPTDGALAALSSVYMGTN